MNTPYDDGVTMYLYGDGEYENIGYCTYFNDFPIASYIQDKVTGQIKENSINVITLNESEIFDLKIKLQEVLQAKLESYKRPETDKQKRKSARVYKVEYNGVVYELEDKCNKEHKKISDLIYSLKIVHKALAENLVFKIYIKRGITYLDDNVLRFINYIGKGSAEISKINEHYMNVLAEIDILITLKKLEQLGCIAINGNRVCITTTGKNIV